MNCIRKQSSWETLENYYYFAYEWSSQLLQDYAQQFIIFTPYQRGNHRLVNHR